MNNLAVHGKPLFAVQDLTLGYAKRTVLRNTNLTIHPGEFWFFLGPNGEGKSTFLKGLLGALKPLGGTLVSSQSPLERKSNGYVPQRCDLNPSLPTTVREFVSLGLAGLKTSKIEEQKRLAWALGRVNLQEFAARDYWALSGGQRQRALVARALVRRPTLLIADEPTNGLDVTSETQLLHGLRDLNRDEKLTIIFVTHQLSLAARYATHVAVFHEGKITGGGHQEILDEQRLSRVYNLSVEDFRAAFGSVNV